MQQLAHRGHLIKEKKQMTKHAQLDPYMNCSVVINEKRTAQNLDVLLQM